MTEPTTDPGAGARDVIEYIAEFRCEWDSHPATSDEDRLFARELVDWLEADGLMIAARPDGAQ
jgi:hypothetical protein